MSKPNSVAEFLHSTENIRRQADFKGAELTDAARLVGALVRRLGGAVCIRPGELDSVEGIELRADPPIGTLIICDGDSPAI